MNKKVEKAPVSKKGQIRDLKKTIKTLNIEH